ncbi:DUF2971 domain-containing protein [Vibrio parahaemolyticus]|nr:DUF2971 domain-containing protein [Vibrio parahaemolyticus]
MFEFQRNKAEYLYHYTKSDTAINFILKNKNLRFSSMTTTNDPKETKEWFLIPGSNEGRSLTEYTPEYLAKVLTPYLQGNTKLLCFSSDKDLKGSHLEDMPNRGFCKPRMWAQYGDNHRGICLIFDYERLFSHFHEQHKMRTYSCNYVKYKDRLIADIQMDPAFIINVDHLEKRGAKDYSYDHLLKFKERLYFEKASDWANENEFRFVVFETEEELFLDYKNALRGIVFGHDCTDSDISSIVSATKSLGIRYQKLKWRNCTPWFEYERTKWL